MFERVTAILRENTDHKETPISMDSSLVEDLGLSSLEVINLVLAFEDEFEIEIPERIIPTMHTVGDIVAYLEKNA